MCCSVPETRIARHTRFVMVLRTASAEFSRQVRSPQARSRASRNTFSSAPITLGLSVNYSLAWVIPGNLKIKISRKPHRDLRPEGLQVDCDLRGIRQYLDLCGSPINEWYIIGQRSGHEACKMRSCCTAMSAWMPKVIFSRLLECIGDERELRKNRRDFQSACLSPQIDLVLSFTFAFP